MRMPKIVLHIFDSESKSVAFGWALSMSAHAFFAARPAAFTADTWLTIQMLSAGLVGGKLLKESYLEGRKNGNGNGHLEIPTAGPAGRASGSGAAPKV